MRVGDARVVTAAAGAADLGLRDADLASGGVLRLDEPLVAAGQALAVQGSANGHDDAAEGGADDGSGGPEGGEEHRGGDCGQRSSRGLEPVDLELGRGGVGHRSRVCPAERPIPSRSQVVRRSGAVRLGPMTSIDEPLTRARQMLNKVPEVTVYFWVIKILCTTVGESFADYINETLGFGLTNTTLVFTRRRWSRRWWSSSGCGATSRRSTGSPSC